MRQITSVWWFGRELPAIAFVELSLNILSILDLDAILGVPRRTDGMGSNCAVEDLLVREVLCT